MRWRLPSKAVLILVVAVQALCTLFFVWDILAGILGLDREPLSWRMREMMEMGASIGLVLGVALGAVLLVNTLRRNQSMETQLRQASGAFRTSTVGVELVDSKIRLRLQFVQGGQVRRARSRRHGRKSCPEYQSEQ
jgi:hypothetical protein